MRTLSVAATLAILTACWLLQAEPTTPRCRLRIELIDAETLRPIAGLVRIADSSGRLLQPVELVSRGLGLRSGSSIQQWSVVTGPVDVTLPRSQLTVAAFSGLEYERSEVDVNLTGREEQSLRIPLHRFYNAQAAGYRNANTHVHVRQVTRDQSDQYLQSVARADGLDLVFVSYLERAEADVDYTSNRYTRDELRALSVDGVQFDNGEEHRHNFGAGDEGYGHVMLLNIPELVLPVSIGPGISHVGTDGIPIRRGIDRAREMGGTIIWCHNKWGLEDIPNWLTGGLHANNIFDGGTHGSYQHSFYRYWDIGLRVPVSTGTDWFIYDFSRVYALTRGDVTPEQWLAQLAKCRSYITNGPLLEFEVDNVSLGGEVSVDTPRAVHIRGAAQGRLDFSQLELIQNGHVIARVPTTVQQGHFVATLNERIVIDKPCWLALRTPPPAFPGASPSSGPTRTNEYGEELFSHTSPIFVTYQGKRPFQRFQAESLLQEMQSNREFIVQQASFASDDEQQQVTAVYDAGIAALRERMKNQP